MNIFTCKESDNTPRYTKGVYASNDPKYGDAVTDLIYDNENSEKYIIGINQIKLYNSAIYLTNSHAYLLYLSDVSGYIGVFRSSESTESWISLFNCNQKITGWTVYSNNYIYTVDNFQYIADLWNYGFDPTKDYSSDIPMFTDAQEAIAYITKPYVPPVQHHVSGGGGGLYGGYKGVIN